MFRWHGMHRRRLESVIILSGARSRVSNAIYITIQSSVPADRGRRIYSRYQIILSL
jgi:hypothetical protein